MFDSTSHICMPELGSIIVSSNLIFTLTAVKINTQFFFCYLLQIQSSHKSFMWTAKCLYNILTTQLIKIKKFFTVREISNHFAKLTSEVLLLTQLLRDDTKLLSTKEVMSVLCILGILTRVNMWFEALNFFLCYTKPFKNVLWNYLLCHFILLSAIRRQFWSLRIFIPLYFFFYHKIFYAMSSIFSHFTLQYHPI